MTGTSPAPGAGKWLAGGLVSVGIFIALLDTTIVDIVLPKMIKAIRAGADIEALTS